MLIKLQSAIIDGAKARHEVSWSHDLSIESILWLLPLLGDQNHLLGHHTKHHLGRSRLIQDPVEVARPESNDLWLQNLFVESSHFGMTSCAGSPSFSLASSLDIMSALPAPQAAKTQQLAALTAGRVRVTLAGGGFGESVMCATIRPPSSKLGSWYF